MNIISNLYSITILLYIKMSNFYLVWYWTRIVKPILFNLYTNTQSILYVISDYTIHANKFLDM